MFKKSNVVLLSILTAFILLLIPTVLSSANKCGDVNSSGGEPDISDIVSIIDYLYLSHTPLDCGTVEDTVKDIDGYVYPTVTIGTQVWMAENLKVTHYRNGDAILYGTDASTWAGLNTGACCDYNSDFFNVAVYGRFYNWYAVDDSRNIAPEGWHVATDEEWKQLEMYLGMSQVEADAEGWRGTDEGGKLKEAGTTHWVSPNTGATNESGFSALPGGSRSYNGYYGGMGYHAYFWSSTESSTGNAWRRDLRESNSEVLRDNIDKHNGFSVRCVKD